MTRLHVGMLVAGLALGASGCVAQGRVSGGIEARSDPTLVELQPGVWVIEDYDEPVFYADGFYWLYRDDGWFRSRYHTGGWARHQSVPQTVVRIQQPRAYVRYRAAAGVRVRSGPRGAIIVRNNQPTTHRQPIDRPRTNVRDDRQDRRDHDQDKRGHSQDRHDDKRGHGQDRHDDKRDHDQGKRDDKRDHDKDKDKRDDKQHSRDKRDHDQDRRDD